MSRTTLAPTVVDLFAGCGGLGLGLEQAGFKPVFVNELHHDALKTYLLNRADAVVTERANHSNDILEITQRPGELEALADRLHREHGDVTLVAGGPPCQGYSGIGHRRSFVVTKEEIPSNHLYREMARFIEAVAPKAFLFENVRGLLVSRWTPNGSKGEIWREVENTFKSIHVRVKGHDLNYVVRPSLIRAKDYGVPQNRPRVLMVGIRSDINRVQVEGSIADGLLPGPTDVPADPVDLLGDLADAAWMPGGIMDHYVYPPLSEAQIWMRTTRSGDLLGKGAPLTEQQYSRHTQWTIERFRHMLAHGGEVPSMMRTKKFAQRVLPERWGPNGPNVTVASLPDDFVHYSLPRVPTVREWARLQTFPDWYQFAGKRTTGGRRRAGDPSIGDWTREVPKFTQIGNAIPVKVGEAVGKHLLRVLGKA